MVTLAPPARLGIIIHGRPVSMTARINVVRHASRLVDLLIVLGEQPGEAAGELDRLALQGGYGAGRNGHNVNPWGFLARR